MTDVQMNTVAAFISTDDGRCLEQVRHSIACGDGWECVKIRSNLARAFAQYFLKQTKFKEAA